MVYSLPVTDTIISGIKSNYVLGDTINATCVTGLGGDKCGD